MAPLVRTGGSRHTGLAAPPHRNIHVKEAGATYKIPLEHNLANLETIRRVEWFQNQCNYPENVYLLDSRFW